MISRALVFIVFKRYDELSSREALLSIALLIAMSS